MRCRISHLALCPRARIILNLIYGPKSDRESVDDYNLRVAQLWNEMATQFVNSDTWLPSSAVEYYEIFKDLDTTVPPAAPGLDVQTIKETWHSVRTDWSRLFTAVFGQTGASTTAGEQLYDTAYKNFINGSRMHFTHKVVAMYVFMLWHENFTAIPQWCNRTLAPNAMLRAGVGDTSIRDASFTSPDSKGKTNGRPQSPATLEGGALDKLLQVVIKKIEAETRPAGLAASEATAKTERMAAIQKQLEVLHSAKKSANFDDTRDTDLITKYTTAIDNLNKKLLNECDLE
jgi:hypothetical protein